VFTVVAGFIILSKYFVVFILVCLPNALD